MYSWHILMYWILLLLAQWIQLHWLYFCATQRFVMCLLVLLVYRPALRLTCPEFELVWSLVFCGSRMMLPLSLPCLTLFYCRCRVFQRGVHFQWIKTWFVMLSGYYNWQKRFIINPKNGLLELRVLSISQGAIYFITALRQWASTL